MKNGSSNHNMLILCQDRWQILKNKKVENHFMMLTNSSTNRKKSGNKKAESHSTMPINSFLNRCTSNKRWRRLVQRKTNQNRDHAQEATQNEASQNFQIAWQKDLQNLNLAARILLRPNLVPWAFLDPVTYQPIKLTPNQSKCIKGYNWVSSQFNRMSIYNLMI